MYTLQLTPQYLRLIILKTQYYSIKIKLFKNLDKHHVIDV